MMMPNGVWESVAESLRHPPTLLTPGGPKDRRDQSRSGLGEAQAHCLRGVLMGSGLAGLTLARLGRAGIGLVGGRFHPLPDHQNSQNHFVTQRWDLLFSQTILFGRNYEYQSQFHCTCLLHKSALAI